MAKNTTTLSADVTAAINAAVAAVLAGQQATPAPVAEATSTTSTSGKQHLSKAGRGMVWFVKTDGTAVKATKKQATAWENLRKGAQARAASRTPEQRAASQARQAEFLAGAAARKAEREAIKPLNKVLAKANGGTWVAAHEASDAVLDKADALLKEQGLGKAARKAALDAAKARRARKA